MSSPIEPLDLNSLDVAAFNIDDLDSEIRVDRLTVALVKTFFLALTENEDLPAIEAGELCHGVDYFLREFIIGERQENLFQIDPDRIRQFAGHWYIIRTAEPNMSELALILAGVNLFYQFLTLAEQIKPTTAEAITQACGDITYYQQRIEDFWAIEDDGYTAWQAACPLVAS